MASGKTADFSTKILEYMAEGSGIPAHDGLYVVLLSALPSTFADPGPPFSGIDLAGVEVSAGNYRAFLSKNTLNSYEIDNANDCVNVTNVATEVEFPIATGPFYVSGYALTTHPTSTASDVYVAYEFFTGANTSKRRTVNTSDTIKINSEGLLIREK